MGSSPIASIFSHPPHGGCGLKSGNVSVACHHTKSSSAWRMWIEMLHRLWCHSTTARHPPHGGCGLKLCKAVLCSDCSLSSSAWRMWIEICWYLQYGQQGLVILRMEDVDWNFPLSALSSFAIGHPPHGGCGLKFISGSRTWGIWCHPPHGGCGLKFFSWFAGLLPLSSSSAWRMWIEITLNI